MASRTKERPAIRLATVDGEPTGEFARGRELALSDGQAEAMLIDYLHDFRRRLDPRGDFAFHLERLIVCLEQRYDWLA
jgi:hypothetical protein